MKAHERGPFYDAAKAARAVEFIEKLLVHTKSIYARRPFILEPWQRTPIEDIFGTVRWDDQYGMWVRQYRLWWDEKGRGNGKSEELAAIGLLLLCGDDEEAAEVYGCAKDRDQAGRVYGVAKRMVELGPLSKVLRVIDSKKRIVYPKTDSFYQVIAADAAGELGENPHGILFDEVVAQPNRELWDALKTGMGKRPQPFMAAKTTAGPMASDFARKEHAFSLRVAEDPQRDPTRYVTVSFVPTDADPFDESEWHKANPALGNFLSIQTLRDEAHEANGDPDKTHTFRLYRLNQWRKSRIRLVSMDAWRKQAGPDIDVDALQDRACYGGLDLGAVDDMTAWLLVFPEDDERNAITVVPQFWVPQAQVDRSPNGRIAQLADDGWVHVTPGNVTDYDAVKADVLADDEQFGLVSMTMDYSFQGIQLAQQLQAEGIVVSRFRPGFKGFAEPMVQFKRRVLNGLIHHGSHAALDWCIENLSVEKDRDDHMRPVKEDDDLKIDGAVALIMAIGEMTADLESGESAYEQHGLTMA